MHIDVTFKLAKFSRVLNHAGISKPHLHSFIQTIVNQRNRFEWREVIEQEMDKEREYLSDIQELGEFVAADQMDPEVMVASRDQYLVIKQVGRNGTPIRKQQRHQVYDILEALQRFWTLNDSSPEKHKHLFRQLNQILLLKYDAILIDELKILSFVDCHVSHLPKTRWSIIYGR